MGMDMTGRVLTLAKYEISRPPARSTPIYFIANLFIRVTTGIGTAVICRRARISMLLQARANVHL